MLESLQPASYGVISTFFVLTTLTILLRIYSRACVVKSFGWDDWCMVLILFFNGGQQFILYYFLHYGGGLPFVQVMTNHPDWMKYLTNALLAEEIMYVWMHFIIKTAFLLFYLRFATKLFRKMVYFTMGLNTIFTVTIWLIYCLQCIPLDAFFHPAMHPTVKCLNNSILAFVPAALTIFTDVLIVVLPIQPLWAIQVSLRKRLMLIFIVSLGGIVVVISCVRLMVLVEFQKGTNFTYTLGKLIIISCIELEVAIMCANAPSLRVLWSKWVRGGLGEDTSGFGSATAGKYGMQSSGTSRSIRTKRRSGNVHASYAVDCSNYLAMERKDRKEADERVDGISNNSEEQLVRDDSRILVTQSVGVITHDAHPRSPNSAGKIEYPNQFEAV